MSKLKQKVRMENFEKDQFGMNGIKKDISSQRLHKETLHSGIRTRHQESSCREQKYEELFLTLWK